MGAVEPAAAGRHRGSGLCRAQSSAYPALRLTILLAALCG
jgi:hypothetical protein